MRCFLCTYPYKAAAKCQQPSVHQQEQLAEQTLPLQTADVRPLPTITNHSIMPTSAA
jgi:hypothetical protein